MEGHERSGWVDERERDARIAHTKHKGLRQSIAEGGASAACAWTYSSLGMSQV